MLNVWLFIRCISAGLGVYLGGFFNDVLECCGWFMELLVLERWAEIALSFSLFEDKFKLLGIMVDFEIPFMALFSPTRSLYFVCKCLGYYRKSHNVGSQILYTLVYVIQGSYVGHRGQKGHEM